jgi:hypothetical protein
MPAVSNKQGKRNLSEKWSARTYQSEVMADPKAPRAHIPTGPQANALKALPASLRMRESCWACVGSPNPSKRNKNLPRMIRQQVRSCETRTRMNKTLAQAEVGTTSSVNIFPRPCPPTRYCMLRYASWNRVTPRAARYGHP